MSLRGVTIKEGGIGSNVSSDSREFGLVAGAVASGELQHGKVLTFRRLADAEALGITDEYDKKNDVRLSRHVKEFYRLAGDGKKLHVVLVAPTTLPAAMVTAAKMLVVESGGMISDIAFAFNPGSEYQDQIVDGINSDVKTAIPALQTFAEWADEMDMPLHVILEGRGISDTLSALADLRALKNSGNALSAHKVSLVVGQDWIYAETLSEKGKKFADVGSFLGVVASQNWNRNPGEVETQNLSNASRGIWLVGGLSNHKKYSEIYESLASLDEKAYIFPIRYQGLSGYWWNDGHCCAPVVLDASGKINQHAIYYSHTMDMCKRALRAAFLPEVKKPVDLEGGKLPQATVDYYNAVGNAAFERLAASGLISDGYTFTDPDSDLLVEKVLRLQFAVIPTGCINEIVGTINLKSN